MRVCLVSAPTIAEFRDLDAIASEDSPRIPLGVISLAGELERVGIRPDLVDLDLAYTGWISARQPAAAFCDHAVARLAERNADVYGFSSLCGSYPLTLRMVSALKQARPGCRIVLGGPQATATAEATLAALPVVDAVVRGEGERILPQLLDRLASGGDLSTVRGLTYRTQNGVAHTVDAALLDDLDSLSLPLQAFRPYMESRRYGSVSLEVGRGCPYACTFCSTSLFFGRRFRMKSAARIVTDMLALHREFAVRSFHLVHDNFTADRRRVVAFCEAVSAAAAGFTWTCSSRTDCLDDDLVERMRAAGCRGLFLGIESGSEEIQRSTNKRLDLGWARSLVLGLSRRRVRSTLSFMTGFPEETEKDLRQTVSFFLDSLRYDHLEPQLTLLAPLAGTPLHARHRHQLLHDQVVSDMAFQGDVLAAADRSLIARHPALFSSFYSVPTRWIDRAELGELHSFLTHTRLALRWLLVAAAQLEGGGLEMFRAFRSWRMARSGGSPHPADPSGAAVRSDFVRFARQVLAPAHPRARHTIHALARYYSRARGSTSRKPRGGAARGPMLARNVTLTRIACDGAALIVCLRAGGDLATVPRRASVLVTRQLPTHDRLVRMSEAGAELLRLCDGTRDVESIVRAFRHHRRVVQGVPAEAVARLGLDLLLRKRLVTWPAAARRAARAAPSSRPAAEGRGRRPSSVRAPDPGSPAPPAGGRAERASAP